MSGKQAMTDTAKELAELLALRDAATPGEWKVDHAIVYFPRNAGGFCIADCPRPVENAAFIASIHRAIALAQRLQAEMEASRKEALEDAANKFDGTTGYNWTAADGYANAFEIAAELRYMASEIPNAAIKAQQETKHEG